MSIPLQKIFEAERRAKEIIQEAENAAKKLEQDARKKAEELLDATREKCLTLNDECQAEADKEAAAHKDKLKKEMDGRIESWEAILNNKRTSLISSVVDMVLKRSATDD